jgi:hypothetical protein
MLHRVTSTIIRNTHLCITLYRTSSEAPVQNTNADEFVTTTGTIWQFFEPATTPRICDLRLWASFVWSPRCSFTWLYRLMQSQIQLPWRLIWLFTSTGLGNFMRDSWWTKWYWGRPRHFLADYNSAPDPYSLDVFKLGVSSLTWDLAGYGVRKFFFIRIM